MPKSREVDAWFEQYRNPMKPVVQRIREIVLAADPRMGECIKWPAPTFTFEGNLASFFPRSKQHASLMFHGQGEDPRPPTAPRGRRRHRPGAQDRQSRGSRGGQDRP